MKKSLLYILSSLLLMVAGGCSDDLNLSPISNKNIEGFYKTQSQFEQAIIGCYHGLRNANLKSNFSYQLTECRSDNAWQQVDYDDGLQRMLRLRCSIQLGQICIIRLCVVIIF